MKKLTKQIAKICSKCKRELKNCPDIIDCIKLDAKLPKKKKHYIYVARYNNSQHSWDVIISNKRFKKLKNGQFECGEKQKIELMYYEDFKTIFKIKLKEGEQKLLPMPIDKAEVVR